MKKLILIILAISFYPFGCEAQVNGTLNGPDECDTIYVENPKQEAEIVTLTSEVSRLFALNEGLDAAVVIANETISSKNATIIDLEAALAVKPDTITITETVEVIVEVIPEVKIDTIVGAICWAPEYDGKVWMHIGDINTYPHSIGIPIVGKGFINVEFESEFTQDMKKWQQNFKLERTIDYENGSVKYRNLFVDPSEYMPEL